MPRPKKIKIVNFKPEITYFKPQGVPLRDLKEEEITIDELETLRLSNIEKLSQIDAAKKMKIHQSTFQRTLSRANVKLTNALVFGKAIKIYGGEYKMPGRDGTGPVGTGFGRGKGRMGGPNATGPTGVCKCPKCGYEETHPRAKPCNQTKCPKCETLMIRE